MHLLHFARQMRRRGWYYKRQRKGIAAFGMRFPNGRGTTVVLDLAVIGKVIMRPGDLAQYHTDQAALAAQYVPEMAGV